MKKYFVLLPDDVTYANDLRRLYGDLIEQCRKHGAVLDLATSDVCMYVEDCTPELAEIVRKDYPQASLSGSKLSIPDNH